jgi:hypothetical protein
VCNASLIFNARIEAVFQVAPDHFPFRQQILLFHLSYTEAVNDPPKHIKAVINKKSSLVKITSNLLQINYQYS